MHSRTATEKDVLVVTEGCKDVAASALLEKDPNTTAGNYVNMIRSLLPAVIALYKEELVLVNLSPQQVFWTGDAAKFSSPTAATVSTAALSWTTRTPRSVTCTMTCPSQPHTPPSIKHTSSVGRSMASGHSSWFMGTNCVSLTR